VLRSSKNLHQQEITMSKEQDEMCGGCHEQDAEMASEATEIGEAAASSVAEDETGEETGEE
jgi:hypothetical protein